MKNNQVGIDMFNLNGVNPLYQKISFDIFCKERAEQEKVEAEVNNQMHIKNIQEQIQHIDKFRVAEKIHSLEKEVKNKIRLIETVENILKNFIFNSTNLPESSKLEIIRNDIPLLRGQLINIRSKLDNLDAQSIDSIKKMKNEYDNGDEKRLVDLSQKLQLKIKELKDLTIILNCKSKILLEKETANENNKMKVYKNEVDLKYLSENLFVSQCDNNVITGDIDTISLKLKNFNEGVNLEGNFIIKKLSTMNKGNFTIYTVLLKELENSVQIDKNELDVFKKALNEKTNNLKKYENFNMLDEDSKILSKRYDQCHTLLELTRNKWQVFLSFCFRVFLNKFKIKNIKLKIEENDKQKISLYSIKNFLNEITLNETNLKKCLLVIEPLKFENSKLCKTHQKRLETFKKLESN
jgi:hypothetical protein